MEKIILSAECLLYPKDKVAHATLTKQKFTLNFDGGEEIIAVDDITGMWVLRLCSFIVTSVDD